ncbi:MAG: TonB-dependent receptor [Draconibacterium sp.]
MRVLGLLFVVLALPFTAISQQVYTLSGVVNADGNQPLPAASVLVSPGNYGAVTDKNGKFIIGKLPTGDYTVQVTYLGYKKYSHSFQMKNNVALEITLEPELLNLNEIIITDNYAEQRKREESVNIEVVNEQYLKQNLGGSLMKSLDRLPGISTMDIGSGQSKPVIRGLGFNRVVVTENGIKHESQQWGADHGLEVDQFASDRIEVIKGPSSLMYGSDGIGGVIELKQKEIPAKNSLGGNIDLIGKTNNNFAGFSALFYKRRESLYYTARVTMLDFADYRVPADSVDIYSYKAPLYKNRMRNTAGNETDLHFSAGYVANGFSTKVFLSNVYNKSGFFANAHGLEPRRVDTNLHDKSDRDVQYPYQTVNHFKAISKTEWRTGQMHFLTEFGFQRNFRQELSQYVSHGYMPAVFPDSLLYPSDLELEFDKYILSANLKTEWQASEKAMISLGIQTEYQNNKTGGRGFIIPTFTQFTSGGFVHVKYNFSENSILQAGLRYDLGMIESEAYSDWFPSPVETKSDTNWAYLQRAPALTRRFSSFTGSVGYSYNSEHFSAKANLGKSFRMPIAKELAANGVNYHHFSYEVGNPGLSPEVSYQFDGGLEIHTQQFAAGVTPFVNYFLNYIYLNPSYEHDRLYGNGNQVFYYTQSRVFRWGGEIHSHFELTKNWQLGLIAESVYSVQLSGEKKGFTLPFSPPASVLLNLKYAREKAGIFRNPYFSIDYRITAKQNNIVPPEEKTPGSAIFNLALGAGIPLKNQVVSVAAQVQNLFNTKYFNHTSYYRLINVPESGRNLVINVNIPFRIK